MKNQNDSQPDIVNPVSTEDEKLDTPMGRIMGHWPGDETEDEICQALEEIS